MGRKICDRDGSPQLLTHHGRDKQVLPSRTRSLPFPPESVVLPLPRVFPLVVPFEFWRDAISHPGDKIVARIHVAAV